MHAASEGFETTHKKKDIDLKNIVDDSIAVIEPYVTHKPEVRELILKIAADAHQCMRNTDESSMDIGFCHGDQHGFNAHLHEGVLAFYDFEECGMGYRVFDLSAFKSAFKFDDKGEEHWTAFAEGYESVRPIRPTDKTLLDRFVVLRELWLIAFHMRNAKDFGHDNTSDAYIDFWHGKLQKLMYKSWDIN